MHEMRVIKEANVCFKKKKKANVVSLTTTMSNDCYSLRILQDYKEMFLDKQIKNTSRHYTISSI